MNWLKELILLPADVYRKYTDTDIEIIGIEKVNNDIIYRVRLKKNAQCPKRAVKKINII